MPDFFTYGMLTGGYTYSPEIISIALDNTATDLDELRGDIKSMIFHEAYHVIHNYTGQTGPFSLLECALQEGSATLFEMKYVNGKQKDLLGNYKQHSISQLSNWLSIIKSVSNSDDMSRDAYSSIAFYDESDSILEAI